jgi:hypothetical protein
VSSGQAERVRLGGALEQKPQRKLITINAVPDTSAAGWVKRRTAVAEVVPPRKVRH